MDVFKNISTSTATRDLKKGIELGMLTKKRRKIIKQHINLLASNRGICSTFFYDGTTNYTELDSLDAYNKK